MSGAGLDAARRAGDPAGEAHAQLLLALGDYPRAVSCYERSLYLCRELADRYNEAATLDRLGDVHDSAGDQGAARWAWNRALRTFDEIEHPEGDEVRAKLCGPGARLPAVI